MAHAHSLQFEVRPFARSPEYAACEQLQRDIWGATFDEVVPESFLKITQKIGGIAAGAFAPDDTLLAFVFGMTGVKDGELVHWSHMLGVRDGYRDHGFGRILKEYQRDFLRPLGVTAILWTYDPLIARNAHFNLNRLRASVVEFVPDMYGSTGSVLHSVGTDRFVVSWPVQHEPHAEQVSGDVITVDIPCDFDALRESEIERARAVSATFRSQLAGHLAAGYVVIGFTRDSQSARCFYSLSRKA